MRSYTAFAQYYDALTQNVEYAKRAKMLHSCIGKHLPAEMPDHILLDLACGTGSLSEEMAKLGWDVIGVDGSMEMLNIALDKKFDSGLPIQYLQQDMRKLDLFGTISVTLCTLDSINHLPTTADVERVFSRVSLFSNPDALFLFDVNTEYKHRNLLAEQCFVYDLPEVYCVWQNALDDHASDYPVTIQLDFFEKLENGQYERMSETFTEHIYPDADIRKMLADTGFSLLDVLDGDTFAAPCETTQRLLYIARKETSQP